jgi:hypothetical protein
MRVKSDGHIVWIILLWSCTCTVLYSANNVIGFEMEWREVRDNKSAARSSSVCLKAEALASLSGFKFSQLEMSTLAFVRHPRDS